MMRLLAMLMVEMIVLAGVAVSVVPLEGPVSLLRKRKADPQTFS